MKKEFILTIFVIVIVIVAIIFFNRKEDKMDNILNSKLSKGQSLEFTTNYDSLNQPFYYGITMYEGGRKEKGYSFNRKKELCSYIIYEYNRNNNLIKVFDYHLDGTLFRTDYYKYDEKNRLLEYYSEIENVFPEYTYTTTYEYDDNDNLIKTVEYQYPEEETNLYSYSEYEYDTRLLSVKNYLYINEDKEGILKSYDKYEYDEEGKLSKIYMYNADHELTNTLTYEYRY